MSWPNDFLLAIIGVLVFFGILELVEIRKELKRIREAMDEKKPRVEEAV